MDSVRCIKYEVNYRDQVAYIEETSDKSWAVRVDQFCLSKSKGALDFEPPTAENAQWLADHRWPDSDSALKAWGAAVNVMLDGGGA